MGSARGRKRRGAQETRQTGTDQNLAISLPFDSRYPRRSSRGVDLQLLSPSSGNPLGIINHNPGQSGSSPPFDSRYPKRSSRGVVPQLLSPSSGNPSGIINHNPGQSCSSPPFDSRYPKRSSRGVVPQLLSPSSGNPLGIINRNPGQSRSLKPALRYLKEARVIPKPEFQNFSSQPAEDPVCEISVDNVKPSTSPGSPSCSATLNQKQINLDDVYTKLVSQVEGPDEVAPQPQDLNGNSQQQINLDDFSTKLVSQVEGPDEVAPQPQNLNGNSQPSRENDVVLRAEVMQEKSVTNDVPPSGHCLTPSCSLNLTEFARALHDDSDDDPDEVESAPDPSYGNVHGHRVKIEIAPLLREIFQRYGDITVETTVKSPNILSFLLERLCIVYQRLEQRKLFDLTHLEINEMLGDLQFIESQKINARWLLEKLEEISEAKTSLKTYMMCKDEAKKCLQSNGKMREELELHRRHIVLIQKKVSAAEEVMVANEAKANECTKMALDIKTRVKALANKPLVYGLL